MDTMPSDEQRSFLDAPPMLPSIARDPKFVNCTALEAVDYSRNLSLRATLMDTIRCWIGHCEDVFRERTKLHDSWDRKANGNALAATYAVVGTGAPLVESSVAVPPAATDPFPSTEGSPSAHLDPRIVLSEMKRLELNLSFHEHFTKPAALAILRVLKHCPEAPPLIATLQKHIEELKIYQETAANDVSLLEIIAGYFVTYPEKYPLPLSWGGSICDDDYDIQALYKRIQIKQEQAEAAKAAAKSGGLSRALLTGAGSPAKYLLQQRRSDGSFAGGDLSQTATYTSTVIPPAAASSGRLYTLDAWRMEDVPDTIAALFPSLRSLWVCSTELGVKRPWRFTSIVRFAIDRVELTVHAACWDALPRLLGSLIPRTHTAVKECLISAQESTVTAQEGFFNLKLSQAEGGAASDNRHLIFADLDGEEDTLFARLEWQYGRITSLLDVVDTLWKNPNKVGSRLTDPFAPTAQVDPLDESSMPTFTFNKAVRAINEQDAPHPTTIVNRVRDKFNILADQESPQRTAARVPFEKLSAHMAIHVSFSPPTVTITGGPLSPDALETAQSTLPKMCTNINVDQKHHRNKDDCSFVVIPHEQDVTRMVIREQYCETSVHLSAFLHTILSIVESEQCWNLMTSHALMHPGDGGEVHWFLFRKSKPPVTTTSGSPTSANTPTSSSGRVDEEEEKDA